MKKISIFLVMLLSFLPVIVFAQSEFKCDLTVDEYNHLKEYLTDNEINSLSCEMINGIKNDKDILLENKKYDEVLYYDNEGNMMDNVVRSDKNIYMPQASLSHSTTYKQLDVTVVNSVSSDGSYKYVSVEAILKWKKMPKVRDFDAFGLVVSNGSIGFNPSEFHLIEIADNNATRKNYSFVNDSNNKGYAFVFGINANASRILTYQLYTKGTIANNPSKINVSYQHAGSKISLSDATSINFSTSGYGGVFNYRTANARNSYDQMAGLSFNLNW